jgi:hypothetical protein
LSPISPDLLVSTTIGNLHNDPEQMVLRDEFAPPRWQLRTLLICRERSQCPQSRLNMSTKTTAAEELNALLVLTPPEAPLSSALA